MARTMSGAQVRQAMARELADAWQAGHRQEVQCVLDTCPTIAWICSDHPLMEGMRWSPEEDRMIRKYFYLGYSDEAIAKILHREIKPVTKRIHTLKLKRDRAYWYRLQRKGQA